jgi:quercetin dioxygenase-like cupin family protein
MEENSKDKPAIPNRGDVESSKVPKSFDGGSFVDLDEEMSWLLTDPSCQEQTGRKSKMLVKDVETRIVLVTMTAGSKWEDHKTNARIIIQPLRGHIMFHSPSKTFDIRPGQLLTLDPGIVHSVSSPEESTYLLILSSANQQ